MLQIENRILFFRTNTIWFSDAPFDMDGVDSLTFMSCRAKRDAEGFRRLEQATIIFDLTQPLESLWGAMDKTNRQRIKKAEKEGVKVQVDRNYDEFIELNNSFRSSKGLPPHSVSADYMKKYGILFTMEQEGELLAGSFNLKDERNMRGLIGASKRLEVDKDRRSLVAHANRLVEWEIIKYGKEHGMDAYDFGGYYIGATPDQEKQHINEFKKSFGGQLVNVYHYRKDYSVALKIVRAISKIRDGKKAGTTF